MMADVDGDGMIYCNESIAFFQAQNPGMTVLANVTDCLALPLSFVSVFNQVACLCVDDKVKDMASCCFGAAPHWVVTDYSQYLVYLCLLENGAAKAVRAKTPKPSLRPSMSQSTLVPTLDPTTMVPTVEDATASPTDDMATSAPTMAPTFATTTLAPTVDDTIASPTDAMAPSSAPTVAPTLDPTTMVPRVVETTRPTDATATAGPKMPPTVAPSTATMEPSAQVIDPLMPHKHYAGIGIVVVAIFGVIILGMALRVCSGNAVASDLEMGPADAAGSMDVPELVGGNDLTCDSGVEATGTAGSMDSPELIVPAEPRPISGRYRSHSFDSYFPRKRSVPERSNRKHRRKSW